MCVVCGVIFDGLNLLPVDASNCMCVYLLTFGTLASHMTSLV